jgi:hypothetical protein
MTLNRRPRSTADDRELRLWRVGRALSVTSLAAVLVFGGVFYGLVYLLDFQEIGTPAKLDAKTLFELVKLSFGVVAGAGALVALVVAYRRQRADEAGAHREATRLHTERFSQAVDKLGSDSPAVRLGGVHALTGLADDAPGDSPILAGLRPRPHRRHHRRPPGLRRCDVLRRHNVLRRRVLLHARRRSAALDRVP